MRVNTGRTGGGRAITLAVLMLAVFTVSVGYGVVLPRLPRLIERLLGPGVEAAQVSWHTGLLTAVYTASLFLFAPLWGRLADRRGPRGVLLLGLLGFGATMLVFSFVESLTAGYAERFLSGMFAAAVTPVAAAVAGSLTTTEQGRARRLAFVSMASIAGFMLGPMLGVIIARFAEEVLTLATPAQSIGIPLAATALLALSVASAVVFAVPSGEGRVRLHETKGASLDKSAWLLPKLLILTFIVSAGVGAFEVGLALRGKQDLGQGRECPGLATRQADGSREPRCHPGLGGGRNALRFCRLAGSVFHADRGSRRTGFPAKSRVAAFARTSQFMLASAVGMTARPHGARPVADQARKMWAMAWMWPTLLTVINPRVAAAADSRVWPPRSRSLRYG